MSQLESRKRLAATRLEQSFDAASQELDQLHSVMRSEKDKLAREAIELSKKIIVALEAENARLKEELRLVKQENTRHEPKAEGE